MGIFSRFVFLWVVFGCLGGCSSVIVKDDSNWILPADTIPESTPWDLVALSEPPAMEWLDRNGEVYSLLYEGLFYQGKPTRVFAYYATPGTLSGDLSVDRNLPAVVLVHGGGGRAFREWAQLWASRGYAAIAMDLAGCGPDGSRLPDGGPGQSDECKFGRIDQPVNEQWSYHAVANVILAHSLIRTFPEVDASRTAITGISWGGYLTCIVAGLDSRFKAAVPVYGCGFLHENSVWLDWFNQKASPAQRRKWVQLWDPSQYMGSASMPVLFVNGGKDFAYPPDSYQKTYNLVLSPKNIRYTPELDHGHIFDRPPEIERFIDHHLNGGAPLPKVISCQIINGQVQAKVKTKEKLISASLHYTTDPIPGDNKNRAWKTVSALVKGKDITAPAAPDNATIWFITVQDEKECLVSSQLFVSNCE